MDLKQIIFDGDLLALDRALRSEPQLANQPVSLLDNPATAHPLHRVCDAVRSGYIAETIAISIARILLENGAAIDGNAPDKKDSPLTAACSLQCDDLALLYIDSGADIYHRGCHGGNSLHWSAWCGRDKILRKLLTLKPDVDRLCIDFRSTPLFWGLHGYRFGGDGNRHHQIECVRMLLESGADRNIPNFEGYLPIDLVRKEDSALSTLFQSFG